MYIYFLKILLNINILQILYKGLPITSTVHVLVHQKCIYVVIVTFSDTFV